jgi:hypothetical protein
MQNEKRQKGGHDKGHNNKLSDGDDEDEEGGSSSKITYGYI